MSNNLPPGVSVSDSDAPWNQEHPEPDWQCTHCDRYGQWGEVGSGDPPCPDCGSAIDVY